MDTPHVAEMTAEDLRPTEATSEWLRRVEAAARLGISERTLDNRLRTGALEKRWHGGHVEVRVPRPADEVQATKAVALLDHYTHDLAVQLAPLLAQVERLARENGELQHRLQRAEARLAEVSATGAEGLRRAEAVSAGAWWSRLLWWRRSPEAPVRAPGSP
jgi:hypothetical protein